jgi:hypothetical protein
MGEIADPGLVPYLIATFAKEETPASRPQLSHALSKTEG